MRDEPTTDEILATLAAVGLGAVIVFDGPVDRCPECRPALAPAA